LRWWENTQVHLSNKVKGNSDRLREVSRVKLRLSNLNLKDNSLRVKKEN
jgi:hypothetical protein